MYRKTIFTFIAFIRIYAEKEFCTIDDKFCDNSDNNFISKSSKDLYYESKIETVKKYASEYVPCNGTGCNCFKSVIHSDLNPFREGITRGMLDAVRNKGSTYIIFQHKLYRSKDCVFPARCSGVEHFLLKLLPKLPNTEFILNSRDWPQISNYFGDRGPVFSFSKTPEYLDIHFPAWSFWEGGPAIKTYPRGLGRWDLLRDTLLRESDAWPWDSKLNKGFFRGSRTSSERDNLILLSRENSNLLDAQYTKNQAWKSPADTLNAEPVTEVTLPHHCRYKYLFNLRGVAASFRFKHLFLCGSLVIHFGEEWTEFFYPALKPWIHYVPIAANASKEEIQKLLVFLQQHDELSAEIAKKGQDFIKTHLKMKHVLCYWKNLIKNYTKLLNFPISLDPLLEEVR